MIADGGEPASLQGAHEAQVGPGGTSAATLADGGPDPVSSDPGAPGSAAWLGWATAGVLLVLVAAAVATAIAANGSFSYPLDDPYIHLRLGQNLADGGTLGVNPGEFASAASSIIWPLLISAGITLVGPVVGIPLALSAASAVVVLVALDRWARNRGLDRDVRIGLMVAMVVVVPLLLMTLTGMEHVLQIGLSILVVHLGIRASFESNPGAPLLAALGAACFLLAATRPEVIFVVGVIGLLLVVKRRWSAAVVAGLATIVPFALIALLNLGQGWPALPASIAAKTRPDAGGIARILPDPDYFLSVLRRPRLLAAMLLVGVVLWAARRIGARFDPLARRWAWVSLSVALAHLAYSQTGWLMRYEAYMVALCCCALALGAQALRACRGDLDLTGWPRRLVAVAVLGLMAIALLDGARINLIALIGMREIHNQQLQMAEFSATTCPGCRVVAGDIGAVSFYGDTTVTDAWGLANRSVLEAKIEGDYDASDLERIAIDEGAQWAMVYEVPETATYPPPDSWIEIGSWQWDGKTVVGGDRVFFFAIDPAVENQLREAFEDFPVPTGAEVLPPD